MMIKISFQYLVLGLFLTILNTACAQPTPDSIKEAERLALETFLDASKSKKARLEAIKHIAYPKTETLAKLLQIGTNRSEDDDIRLVALKSLKLDDNYFNTVLAIIPDLSESETLVAGLIENISRRPMFRLSAEKTQQLQAVLRDRLDDTRPRVRLVTYRTLVSNHDAVAINKLVESLNGGGTVPIPLVEAIQLLMIDGSNKHISTLRPYLNHPNTAVQAQAAKALTVDPKSQEDISGMASSNNTSDEVRINALKGLSREDERFMEYALEIIGNPEERADIRYEAMKAAMGRLNYQGESAETQINFAIVVERVASEKGVRTSNGLDLGEEAKKLIPHLSKTFPAVRRYYQRRRN